MMGRLLIKGTKPAYDMLYDEVDNIMEDPDETGVGTSTKILKAEFNPKDDHLFIAGLRMITAENILECMTYEKMLFFVLVHILSTIKLLMWWFPFTEP